MGDAELARAVTRTLQIAGRHAPVPEVDVVLASHDVRAACIAVFSDAVTARCAAHDASPEAVGHPSAVAAALRKAWTALTTFVAHDRQLVSEIQAAQALFWAGHWSKPSDGESAIAGEHVRPAMSRPAAASPTFGGD